MPKKLSIELTELPGGGCRGQIRTTGITNSDDWFEVGSLNGSLFTNSGEDQAGAIMDVIDALASRISHRLHQMMIEI